MEERTLRGLNPEGLEVVAKAKKAQQASRSWSRVSGAIRSQALLAMAQALEQETPAILAANARDMRQAKEKGITGALLDRLLLTEERTAGMASGLREVAAMPDPVGEIIGGHETTSGLQIHQVRVPLGVIGIVYEARPNVTADAAALCLKAGSVVLLRGGSEALHSNQAIVQVLQQALDKQGIAPDVIQMVTNPDRSEVKAMLRLHEYIDVIIPRGGAGLIKLVVEESSVPVIETGVGNCHVFVDAAADLEQAAELVDNAKTQRPGVCNAAETLLVHADVAAEFLPMLVHQLEGRNVELRGCPETQTILPGVTPATEDDWETEFLDLVLAVRVVASFDDALAHIARYSTGHSEAIITESYTHAERFLHEVDAAAVYVNASTRFTDGGQFGLGAEIGISTQKLHARGPMGLRELTTTKYVVHGSGQIRT